VTTTRDQRFIPAARFSALTPLFDPIVRVTTRERTFKCRLLERAAPQPGEDVLDLGAGTGTLALMLEAEVPGVTVTGLDADPQILSQARVKAAAAGSDVQFVEAFSNAMPFADDSFDLIVSTLFFHHLERDVKRATLSECVRVLRPGGRLCVGDWGRPTDPLMAALFVQVRALDGFAVTADNAHGRLPALFTEAGLQSVLTTDEFRTPLGTIALYSGTVPEG
jgi:ubiquinone/menaquinone biosynthesis C-methylase UbiE